MCQRYGIVSPYFFPNWFNLETKTNRRFRTSAACARCLALVAICCSGGLRYAGPGPQTGPTAPGNCCRTRPFPWSESLAWLIPLESSSVTNDSGIVVRVTRRRTGSLSTVTVALWCDGPEQLQVEYFWDSDVGVAAGPILVLTGKRRLDSDAWPSRHWQARAVAACLSGRQPSAKWGVHINAKYAIYRLLHMLHIKLHISAYFHCIFFAHWLIQPRYLQISCIFLAYYWLYLHIFSIYLHYLHI